jgi:hypothetical protein
LLKASPRAHTATPHLKQTRLKQHARLKQTRAHKPTRKHSTKRRREKSIVSATRNSGSSVEQLDVRPQCRPRRGPRSGASPTTNKQIERSRRRTRGVQPCAERPRKALSKTHAHKQRRHTQDAHTQTAHTQNAHKQLSGVSALSLTAANHARAKNDSTRCAVAGRKIQRIQAASVKSVKGAGVAAASRQGRAKQRRQRVRRRQRAHAQKTRTQKTRASKLSGASALSLTAANDVRAKTTAQHVL